MNAPVSFADSPLTSQQHYRQAVAAVPRLTKEAERDLIQRAQNGEQDALDAVLMQGLHYIDYWACRFHRAYRWATECADYEELLSVGHLALVSSLPVALQWPGDPWSYLFGCVKFAMQHHFAGTQDCIAVPERYARTYGHIPVASLDQPLDEEGAITLGETLAAPSPAQWHRTLPISDEQLSEALKTLGTKQRQVLSRLYGLGETVPESAAEIARDHEGREVTTSSITSLHEMALAKLKTVLDLQQAVYTLDEIAALLQTTNRRASNYVRAHWIAPVARRCYPKEPVDACLRVSQQGKRRATGPHRSQEEIAHLIEEACERLRQRGVPIHSRTLAREAGISSSLAHKYLQRLHQRKEGTA